MSTPLGDLIRSVLTDPDAQAAFASAPEAFLLDHGYTELEPQDVREALYVLADGSPPETAVRLVAGGDALADLDGDEHGIGAAAAGLLGALHAMDPSQDLTDPSDLDGWDDDTDADADADADAGADADDVTDDADGTGAEDDGRAHGGHDHDGHDDGAHLDRDAAPAEPRDTAADDAADAASTSDGDPRAIHLGDLGTGDPDDDLDGDLDRDLDRDLDHDLDGDAVGIDAGDLHGVDVTPDPFTTLPDLDTDLSPLVPDTTAPVLPEDDPGDGWDDVI